MVSVAAFVEVPSAVVEAGKGDYDLYVHYSFDVLSYLGKVGGVDEVDVFVTSPPSKLEELRKVLPNLRLRLVGGAWYDRYSFVHLLDSRARDVRQLAKYDDYEKVIRLEQRSVELMRLVASNSVPRRVGDYLLVFTRVQVPTLDLAYYYALRERSGACVLSARDLGLAFSCVGDEASLRAIDAAVKAKATAFSKLSGGQLTGFVVTYPEAPAAYEELFEEVLGYVKLSGGLPSPSKVQEGLVGLISASSFSPYDFLRLRARYLSKHARRAYIGGKEYVVLSCGEGSAFHIAGQAGGACAVRVVMPVGSDVALLARYRPRAVSLGDYEVEPKVYESSGGYLAVVEGSRRLINESIRRWNVAVLLVPPAPQEQKMEQKKADVARAAT